MSLKRRPWEGSEEGSDSSEFRRREFQRKYGIPSLFGSLRSTFPQELGTLLEPFIRNCVKEEVEFAVRPYLRPSLNRTPSSGSRILQLHFEKKLPSTIFTGCRVESEDGSPITIALCDVGSGKTITSDPLSAAKLTLVVLDGDLNPDDGEDLTEAEFNKKTVRERQGRRPLVTGTLPLTLRQGVAYVEDICFTDNSRWLRSGKFRLGVKVQKNVSEIGVKEGISNAFKVKDQRGESYKKHHPPSLVDEVWRLEKIAKGGASDKRLALQGISNVKDFLRLYHTDSRFLRIILGNKISNKTWETIIGHVTECCLDDDELYMYGAEDGTVLILNSIYQVVGVILEGQNYQSLDALSPSQKRLVEKMKPSIYNHQDDLVPIDAKSFFTSPLQSSGSQVRYLSTQNIGPQNANLTTKRDELEMQMNSGPMVMSSVHANGLEDKNEFQVSMTKTCSQIEASNPTFSNGFVVDGPCSGSQALGYGWEGGFSLGPPGPIFPRAVHEKFQEATPAWQENGFFVSPGNETFGLIASDFGIGISRNGKSKASCAKFALW